MASRFIENVQAQIVGTIVGGLLLSLPGAVFAGAAPLLTALFGQWGAYIIELLVGSAVMLFTLSPGYTSISCFLAGRSPQVRLSGNATRTFAPICPEAAPQPGSIPRN